MEHIYAAAGRQMIPDTEFNFMQEYLMRLNGADYIPVRNEKDYQPRNENVFRRNYTTPLMRSVNKSRFKFQDRKK